MAELRPDEFMTTVVELERCIATREAELTTLESRARETSAAVEVATDPERRRMLKHTRSVLGQEITDVGNIIQLLRVKKVQAARDAALVARGGVVMSPLWPEPFGAERSRFRAVAWNRLMKLQPNQLVAARLLKGRSSRTGEEYMSGRMGGLRVRLINNPNLDDRGPSGARARYLLVVEPWVGDDDFRHEDG